MLHSWRLWRYALPLARPLTTGARGLRRGLIVEVRDQDGATGLGEAAPLPGLHRADLDAAERELLAFLRQRQEPPSAVARFAVEGALLDLTAARLGRRPAQVLAEHPAAEAPLNGLIDAAHDPARRARELARDGYLAAKLKVGRRPMRDEIAAVRAARDAAPDLALRLDANQAWTLDEACRFCEALGDVDLEYIEEPLRQPALLGALHERTGVGIGLDESLAAEAPCVLPEGARALIIKPTVAGGLSGALKLIDLARQRGLLPVISATFETSVGLRLMAELACAIGPGLPAQGLGTGAWLAGDVLDPPLQIAEAAIRPAVRGRLCRAGLVQVAASS